MNRLQELCRVWADERGTAGESEAATTYILTVHEPVVSVRARARVRAGVFAGG
jgi:hypothetical protein